MLRIGIVLDRWKLPIFERHLTEAGYAYRKSNGITPDTITLHVNAESAKVIEPIVLAANTEAAEQGEPPCTKH